jgi:hypothetical protein
VRVQLDASGDGLWAIDDIEYGSSVPEPSTLILFGIAGLLMTRVKWARRAAASKAVD